MSYPMDLSNCFYNPYASTVVQHPNPIRIKSRVYVPINLIGSLFNLNV